MPASLHPHPAHTRGWALLHLDRGVDLDDENKRAHDADEAASDGQRRARDQHVTEVEEVRHRHAGVQAAPVPDGIEKGVSAGHGRGEEGAPPPRPVLGTELEVDAEDGHFGAGDNQDDQDERQEPEHVVVVVGPDAAHDEVQLGEAGPEGEETAKNNGHPPLRDERALRDGAPRQVDAHGILPLALLEAGVRPAAGQRHAHEEPQEDEEDHLAEWHGPRGSVCAQRQVHHEEDAEEQRGEEEGSEEGGILPGQTTKVLEE
mmetsp:Transcript_4643/g.13216  ORF Transcript_4643/g.13216 Transcript_4643/m.13216 type:complete len:260 (-) Transcript_4643:1424-2203(-)